MTEKDSLHAFDFKGFPVRGKLVHLDASWQAVLENQEYPAAIRNLLGQALAASVLLISILKFEGRLTIQLQSDGPVTLVLAQCSSELHVRGLSHWQDLPKSSESAKDSDLSALLPNGRLAITIEPSGKGQRYQGIVPLEANSIAECIEAYFASSEQLPTRLWLACNGAKTVGMLLQRMPGEGGFKSNIKDEDTWPRVQILADSITNEELLELSDTEILHRLFHEEDVRLFDTSPVSFHCSCSVTRIKSMLQGLGKQEVEDIVAEQGEISVSCEFCNRHYVFDPVDAQALFHEATPGDSSFQH